MQENDRPLIKTLTPNPVQQPRHRLAGIHRVQQQTFLARNQFYRRQRPGIRLAIARAEIFVPQLDFEARWQADAQQRCGALGEALNLRPLIFFAARNRHANHWQIRQYFAQRERQAAVGPGAARCQHDCGEGQAGVLDLFGQFQPGAHITQSTQRIGASNRHQIRLFAVAAQACGQCFQLLIGVVEVVHQFDLGIEQVKQQPIAVADIVGVFGTQRIFQQRYASQAQFGGEGGGLAHVVGLQRAGGDQRVRALGQRIGPQVFEFTQLVAAHRQWRQVIAFDVHVAAQPGRQAFEFFQRGRVAEQIEAVKTGELLFDHGSVLAVRDVRTIGTPKCMGNRQDYL